MKKKMNKLALLITAAIMALSLTACGGEKDSDKGTTTTKADVTTAAPKAEGEVADDGEALEYTPEQMAVAETFAAMTDRYNALADKVNADEALLAIPELIDTMNLVADAIAEDDAMFADPANLTDEVLKNLSEGVVVGNALVDELEAMVKNYSGKEAVTVPVEIINDTDGDFYTLAMSPTSNEDWGGNLLAAPLKAGESGKTQMTFTKDSLVWDVLVADSQGTTLTFEQIDFSEVSVDGAKLSLAATEGGAYIANFVE
ncbi:MAG: hypothetical protein RR540_03200 [Oscillospiraceae bacterium]